MVLMCLRHGTPEEVRRCLLSDVGPQGPEDHLVPSDYFNSLVTAAAGRLPQPLSADDLADLWDSMWNLLHAAAAGKPSGEFSALEALCDHQDQAMAFAKRPALQQPEFLKWRHWRPSRVREIEPTTQRALEPEVGGALLAHLVPFAEHIPHLKDILGALDLLGDTRFRTLRQHTRTSGRGACDSMAACPLSPQPADKEVTPYKLRQVWNTLKGYSKTFGMLNVDELHHLKAKWSPARTSSGPWRKGLAMSTWVPPAPVLRQFRKNRHELLDAFILRLARFQVGCSARFNDLQHVHPQDLVHTSDTVELKAASVTVCRRARDLLQGAWIPGGLAPGAGGGSYPSARL